MNIHKLAIRATLLIVVIAAINVAVAIFPVFYNYYIFPLGILRHDISVGDEYKSVKAQFETYTQRYAHDRAFQFATGRTNIDFFYRPIPEAEYLVIYHANIFDDVQLYVLFDEAGLVKEIEFIGD